MQDNNDECKRLRTFIPILQYYCNEGDAYSILRVWKQIWAAPGAHLDSITYALILGALARNKVFGQDAQWIEGVEKLNMSASGPKLFDEIVTHMMDDLVEISEESAIMLAKDFQVGFGTAGEHVSSCEVPQCSEISDGNERNEGSLFVGRVAIVASTAKCPCTGAKLRLLTLDEDQRQQLNKTLLEMAATQQQEFGAHKKKESKHKSSQQAEKELRKFGEWLE